MVKSAKKEFWGAISMYLTIFFMIIAILIPLGSCLNCSCEEVIARHTMSYLSMMGAIFFALISVFMLSRRNKHGKTKNK